MDLAAEEMGFCRDTLMALLDYLVDPLLPSRSTLREHISTSQHELVAKQVHAVVLLYNYYHRKQNPSLAFLEFQSFCKLAVDLKPSLHLYLGVTQETDYSELEEQAEDLTLAEKAIMSACDTAKILDASNSDPIIDGWPITKVAVFLVDSQKENCVLFHSSITQGVWSTIEKKLDGANRGSQALMEARSASNEKQVMKRMAETGLLQLAYLAVKETCGINQANLKILDIHSVYSTSKPKTTVRLYIMQCMQTNQDMNLVPINDVMDSLQGSLVDKVSVTPVVEYFHLLPFANKILDCLKSGREMAQDSLQLFEVTMEDENCNSPLSSMEPPPDPCHHFEAEHICSGSHPKEGPLPDICEQNCTILQDSGKPDLSIFRSKEHPREPVVYKKRNKLQKNSTTYKISRTKTSNVLEDHRHQEAEQYKTIISTNKVDINEKKRILHCEDVVHNQNVMLSTQENDQAAVTRGAIVVAEFPDACSSDRDMGKVISSHDALMITGTASSDGTGLQGGDLVPSKSDFEHLHKMQLTINSKNLSVSKTALQVLLRKREQLSQKLRNVADEVALCEGNIQTILRGGEDHLAVKLETLLDYCNEKLLLTASGAGEDTTLNYNCQDLSPFVKRKRLSEANLSVLSPCQELDGICSKNFWMLPNYNLSPIEGGFQATVNVKGDDFNCSCEGTTCTTPLEARNSAALKVMAKLRSLAAKL